MAVESETKSTPDLTRSFQLGEWLVKPTAGYMSRNGEQIHLEPRVMTVLTLLAKNAGEVVSREQLETGAWPGLIVGYDSLASCILKLRKALGDSTRRPRYIETVSKRGYRLIATVSFDGSVAAEVETTKKPFTRRSLPAYSRGIAAALVALAIGITFFAVSNKGTKSGANIIGGNSSKTLAVMPFINISHEAKNDYFVEGITDDITTNLSNLSSIVVVSRLGTYGYKGQDIDPRKVGKELGADYLVQGSIRKSGNRWRINATLIDTHSGANLWAKRFEGDETSLLDSQDELANSIANSLALELSSTDKKRLEHSATTNFEAYDLFLQGQKLFKERTRESNEAAQDAYRKAIKLDPSFARAHSALAVALTVEYWRNWSDAPSETLDRALSMAKLSVSLDPTSPQSYWALGYALMYRKQHDKAVEAVQQAITLSPNYADGYGLLALINNQLGNGEEAARLIKKGMQLNPHYSWDYPYNLGRAYYVMGNYDDAIRELKIALDRNEQAVNPRLFLVTSYVAQNRLQDAQWEVEKIKAMNPETTISHLENDYPIANKKLQQIFLSQLREAGLPEK